MHGRRARTVVKGLALANSGVNKKNIKRFLSEMPSTKVETYNQDIQSNDYENGQNLDFELA